ncbi:MAG: hypothetical protein M3Y41_15555 [Pseudomonadota bacterium]|nr:hypothetical protein [Pseudomonadota bacterium]
MTVRETRCCAAAFVAAVLLCAVPSFAAGPPQSTSPRLSEPAGTWRLIPLSNVKVPAAWVINTANGDTYLCGSTAAEGRAQLACIEADFSHPASP